jgi:ribonucleotide reductase beta subunit family protein with ferritin-like domain
LTRITTPTESYKKYYPKIVELANKQLEEQFWTNSEMKVELDKMQLRYQLSEEQLHAVKTVLFLFVHYERKVGDFWKRLATIFPRPEIELACSVMEMVERAVHAEFYDQVNVQLGLDTDEHYLAYKEDPILNERAKWLGQLLKSEDNILSSIIFSMTETALLFSSFAILKSFQMNGYNLIPVIVRGTNQSALDEDLHGTVSAEIINTYFNELGKPLKEHEDLVEKIYEAVESAYEHECRIIDLAIPGKELNGIKKEDFKSYVKVRLNVFLNRLGLRVRYIVKDCPIEDWFEKNTYSYKVIDFFTAGQGMEYEGGWDEHALGSAWRKEVKLENS